MHRALSIALPGISFSLFLLAWLALVRLGAVPGYLLPDPVRVAQSLWQGIASGKLLVDTGGTLFGAGAGCAIGYLSGIALGLCLAEWKACERLFLPYVGAFHAIPKVALAPFLFIWMGVGTGSVVTMAALTCFYPVFVSTFVGARSADLDFLDLLRASAASRWFVLRTLRIPSALPHVFAGLQLGVVFALMGAVVMEFVASSRGLGFAIQDSANTADLPVNFAALVTLACLGLSGASLVRAIGSRVVSWKRLAAPEE